jgi:hypothetical protein
MPRPYVPPTQWHRWFVWYPLWLEGNGKSRWIWWEWVERRFTLIGCEGGFVYRNLDGSDIL